MLRHKGCREISESCGQSEGGANIYPRVLPTGTHDAPGGSPTRVRLLVCGFIALVPSVFLTLALIDRSRPHPVKLLAPSEFSFGAGTFLVIGLLLLALVPLNRYAN